MYTTITRPQNLLQCTCTKRKVHLQQQITIATPSQVLEIVLVHEETEVCSEVEYSKVILLHD